MDVKKFTGMNWDDLRYFACFAASGSLSAAARALNVEHATISRRIQSLEADLNLKLVDRRGRKLLLTPSGEEVAAIIEKMEFGAQQVLRHAWHAASDVRGEVKISAPPAFAAAILAEPVTALQRKHPKLRLFISSDIHTAALDQRQADIAIRLRRPEHGDLTMVKLGEMAFRLYARPDYLVRTVEADWQYVSLGGALAHAPQQRAIEAKAIAPGLSADHIEMQLALVRAGAGIAMLPDFLAAEDQALTRIETPPLIREVWLTYHSDAKNAVPIQTVVKELKLLTF